MAGESKIYELALADFVNSQTFTETVRAERRNLLGTAKELAAGSLRCFVSNMDTSITLATRSEYQRDYRVGVYLLQVLTGAVALKEARIDELVELQEQIEEAIGAAEDIADVPFTIGNEVPRPAYDKDILSEDSIFVCEIPVTFTNIR